MRRRILLSIVALTAIAVIAFAVPLGFVLADLYREQETLRLQRIAAETAEVVPARFPETHDPIELPRPHRLIRVAIYDAKGHRVVGLGPLRADAAVRMAFSGDLSEGEDHGKMVVASPLTRGEGVVGVIRAANTLDVVAQRIRNAVLVMVAIGAGAIGLSALIAIYQSRRLARPVDRLAHAAARLGDGDFTVTSESTGMPEIDSVSNALETTAGRLDRLLSRERAFSDDASHQLRTRLTGLRVSLEAAQLNSERDCDRVIDDALTDVDRLERTIDDLLTLAREPRSERPALDVDRFLAAVEDEWHGRLAHAGRPLRVVIDRGLPPVAISERAARQILDVLLDNALRHGAGVVTVHGRSAPDGMVFEVSDEGPGVAGDDHSIFERHAAGTRTHGIGLGLARSLAESEGGRLRLLRAATGPVFTLVVPSLRVDEPDDT